MYLTNMHLILLKNIQKTKIILIKNFYKYDILKNKNKVKKVNKIINILYVSS